MRGLLLTVQEVPEEERGLVEDGVPGEEDLGKGVEGGVGTWLGKKIRRGARDVICCPDASSIALLNRPTAGGAWSKD